MRDSDGKRKEKGCWQRPAALRELRSLSDICSANITQPCFHQSQVSKLP